MEIEHCVVYRLTLIILLCHLILNLISDSDVLFAVRTSEAWIMISRWMEA